MTDTIEIQIPVKEYGKIATAAALEGLDVNSYLARKSTQHLCAIFATPAPAPAAPAAAPAAPVHKPAPTAGMFDSMPA